MMTSILCHTHELFPLFTILQHVVFGEVTEGMDVVRAIEAVGSGTGACKKKVIIEDCGQIA